MIYDNYINSEFTDYLNRYLKGIVYIREKLKKVTLEYFLSQAYSNHTCRAYIDVEFIDYDSLSKDEIKDVNQYFRNGNSSSGSQFVSFNYKPQQSFDIDFDEIRNFIIHYQFASNIFDGFIRDILPESCELEIKPLEKEPVLNYASYFLRQLEYSTEQRNLKKQYFEIIGRGFDFDCNFHSRLKEASKQFSDIDSNNRVSDKELFKAHAGSMEAIRYYVLEEKIPFSLREYLDVIGEIWIDASELLKKIKDYRPEFSFRELRPSIIINILEQKEKERIQEENAKQKLIDQSGIQVGDYIFEAKDYNDVGIVKEIHPGYRNN